MNDSVSFEEDEFVVSDNFYQDKESFMIKFVIRIGLAKDKSQANLVLILIAVIAVVLSVAVAYIFLVEKQPEERKYEDLSEIEKLRLPEEVRNAYENR